MVAYYNIAGKKVGSHILSVGVLGATLGGAFLATRGGGKEQPQQRAQGPPVQAGSKDEENFIQDFLKTADAGGEQKQQ